jgi:mannitol/fructose-specific phosphotransferase system IIA component (Ntr-type)
MKLSAFTSAKMIDLNLAPADKDSVIGSMVNILSRSPHLKDRDLFLRDVLAREQLVTTGVGHGVAFPHAKSDAAEAVVFAFARLAEGIDFGALDGRPVRLIFLIGAPKHQEPPRVYLNLMARLSFLMRIEENRDLLLKSDSVEEVTRLFDSVK